MRCPKCNWQTESYSRDVYARKQDNTPILIKLSYSQCLRKGCDWEFKDTYNNRLKEFNFKPY